IESSARMRVPTTGMRKSGDLARKETRRGAKQRRKTGSTSAFGGLRTKRHAHARGTRPGGGAAPGSIVQDFGRLLVAHDAADVRAEPVAAGVVGERQQQQDE